MDVFFKTKEAIKVFKIKSLIKGGLL